MQPDSDSDDLFELIEFIETYPDLSGLESVSHVLDHILDSVSRLAGSPLSFLYLADSRLPFPRFTRKGFLLDHAADIERFCADYAGRIDDSVDTLPVEMTPATVKEAGGSIRIFPLRIEGNSVSLIGLSAVSDSALPPFFTRLLRTVSCSLNSFLERFKKEQELSNLNKYLTVSSMLAQSMELHELLDITLNCCIEAVSAEAASILLLDDEKKNFFFYAIEGPAKPILMTKTFPSDRGIAAAVLKNQQSEIINDAQNDPRFFRKIDFETGFRTRNMLAVPLVAGDEKIGVLEVLNKAGSASFTQNEHLFLQMIAEEIAFAIRNAKIFDYVVNSYCKQRQGLASCKGCKRPLGSWTPCVKYQNLSGSGI